MQLQLKPEEVELLRELLERASADLREEVYKTEAVEWKRALKDRKQVLDSLLGKFTAGA